IFTSIRLVLTPKTWCSTLRTFEDEPAQSEASWT
ncbi:unnamed protein product, partial [Prunus brigantina]